MTLDACGDTHPSCSCDFALAPPPPASVCPQKEAQQLTAAQVQAHRNNLHEQRMAALTASNGSNGNGAVPPSAAVPAAAARSGPPAVPEQKKVPSDWREVKFATKFKAQFGTFLKVVGGPDQLGAWEIEGAPPLQWSEGDVWSITLLLPPGKHEFKVRACIHGVLRRSNLPACQQLLQPVLTVWSCASKL